MPPFAADGPGYWTWISVMLFGFLGLGIGLLGLAAPRLGWLRRARLPAIGILATLATVELIQLNSWSQPNLQGFRLFLSQLAFLASGIFGAGLLLPVAMQARQSAGAPFSRGLALGLCLVCPVPGAVLLVTVNDVGEVIDQPHWLVHLVPAPGLSFYTDAGTPIQGFMPLAGTTASSIDDGEFYQGLKDFGIAFQVAPGDSNTNCYGWVFTGGRAIIVGESVEKILHENGYEPVKVPNPADLIVYRNKAGEIAHVGEVRATGTNDFVLIESKWGYCGRYLHNPDTATGYGHDYAYYRSSRRGHLLSGAAVSKEATNQSSDQ